MGCEMAGGSSHSDGRRRVGLSSLECHSGPRAPHRAAPPPERMWRRNPSAGRLSRSLASRITPPDRGPTSAQQRPLAGPVPHAESPILPLHVSSVLLLSTASSVFGPCPQPVLPARTRNPVRIPPSLRPSVCLQPALRRQVAGGRLDCCEPLPPPKIHCTPPQAPTRHFA